MLLERRDQFAFEESGQSPERDLLGTVLQRADSVLILGTVQPFEENQRLVAAQLEGHRIAVCCHSASFTDRTSILNCRRPCATQRHDERTRSASGRGR